MAIPTPQHGQRSRQFNGPRRCSVPRNQLLGGMKYVLILFEGGYESWTVAPAIAFDDPKEAHKRGKKWQQEDPAEHSYEVLPLEAA